MFTQNPQLRFLRPVALTSLVLIGLCVFTAIFMLREQASATSAFRENLGNRRTASDIEESLTDLVGLLRIGVRRLDPLHERIEKHFETIQRADQKPEERHAAALLIRSYDQYAAMWRRSQEPGADYDRLGVEAADFLEADTLPRCRELRDYRTQRIDRSEEEHQQSMRRLAWGMAGVGVTGAIAGLFLGYGVARGLSMTIRRLQVRVQDAAGKLGPDLTEIVLTGEGDLGRLEGQMQELLGRIEHMVGKLQQREREVLRAEQLAAVGQLAAGVAHEIRNPLTSIKILVQAGREDPDALLPEDLEIIEREVMRMESSLKTFLDFARMPKPQRSEQDLNPIVLRTLDLIRGRAANQKVELKLVRPTGQVVVEADAEQIRQVLVNLTLNALDVMPSGGTLEVVVKPSPDSVAVSVLDTGPGIAPEVMPRLFEPFVSTKDTGLGLGLVISRRIVEEHGGKLSAANRLEGGACFTVKLPVDNTAGSR